MAELAGGTIELRTLGGDIIALPTMSEPHFQALSEIERREPVQQQTQQTTAIILRVPAYARKDFPDLPPTVKMLPLMKTMSDLPRGDVVYAVRLLESFTDTAAITRCERWYVVAAMKRAGVITVIEQCDRDPLLVLSAFHRDVDADPDTIRKCTRWAKMPTGDVIFPADLLPTNCGKFIFQNMCSQIPVEHPGYHVALDKYKKTRAIPFSGLNKAEIEAKLLQSFLKGEGVFMDYEAITTSNYADRMMKITLDSEATIATALLHLRQLEVVKGVYVQGKGNLHVLLCDKVSAATVTDISKCLFVRGVESILGVSKRPRTPIKNYKPATTQDDFISKIVIKITSKDAVAIKTDVAPRLCAFLSLKFIKCVGILGGGAEAVLAEAKDEATALALHETCPGGVYRLCWQGAPM